MSVLGSGFTMLDFDANLVVNGIVVIRVNLLAKYEDNNNIIMILLNTIIINTVLIYSTCNSESRQYYWWRYIISKCSTLIQYQYYITHQNPLCALKGW